MNRILLDTSAYSAFMNGHAETVGAELVMLDAQVIQDDALHGPGLALKLIARAAFENLFRGALANDALGLASHPGRGYNSSREHRR